MAQGFRTQGQRVQRHQDIRREKCIFPIFQICTVYTIIISLLRNTFCKVSEYLNSKKKNQKFLKHLNILRSFDLYLNYCQFYSNRLFKLKLRVNKIDNGLSIYESKRLENLQMF